MSPPDHSKATRSTNVTPLRIADASRAVRHVFIRDLELKAAIGVYQNELNGTQPIRINIDLTVQEKGQNLEDRLENVVCYDTVVQQVKQIVREGHVGLVETLAERIAENCLNDERVLVARIRVEKLAVIPEAASVGVEIERHR